MWNDAKYDVDILDRRYEYYCLQDNSTNLGLPNIELAMHSVYYMYRQKDAVGLSCVDPG